MASTSRRQARITALQTLYEVDSTDHPVEDVLRRSEEHTSELQSLRHLVCRLLLEKKKYINDSRVVYVNKEAIELSEKKMITEGELVREEMSEIIHEIRLADESGDDATCDEDAALT